MQKNRIFMALNVFLILLLTGCWDANEPESMVYGNGMGVDYKDGQYIFYTQIMNLGKIAKSESAGGVEKIPEEIGHASAPEIDQALKNLYKTTQRRIFWGHIRFVLFTEEALKHSSLKEMVDLLNRYREFRYRIWMVSTKDPIEKVLLSHPVLDKSVVYTQMSEPVSSFEQLSPIRPRSLRELQINLNEPSHQTVIPMISIVENKWESSEQKRAALKFNGAAILTADTLKGFITNQDMLGFKWMMEEPARNDVLIMKDEKPAALIMVEKPKMSVKPIVKNEKATFEITITAPGTLTEMDQEVKGSYLIKEMNTIIENEIRRTYEKGLQINADVYRLSETLYRNNLKVWKRIENKGNIPLQKDSIIIKVKSKIKSSGKNQNTPSL